MASNESQTQKLIGLYRSCECLWNPQSSGYLSSSVQEDAWRKITRGMNSGLTPDQVKLQVLALRNYYDAERAAIRRSKQEGYSHTPRHSYFHDLLFLDNVLSEETEESKVSFCLDQLSDILEDSITRDDDEPSNYPHNFSKATFSQSTEPLCSRDKDSKQDYTYYKLILEPEKPSISREMENGAVMEKNSERPSSGNDNTRFYPTAYCVPCKKRKPSCKARCQCTDTDSSSSTERCGPCRAMNLLAHKCCSCVSLNEYHCRCSGPSVRSRYAEPGPKLSCQPRPRYVPRSPPLNTGRDRSCCVTNWKRNKNAAYRRLMADLEAQEAQNKSSRHSRECPRVKLPPLEDQNLGCYCKSQVSQVTCLNGQLGTQEGQNQGCCCCISSERRQSGADQMNVCSQPGIPQNCYQPPISLNCTNNNQQDLDYGRYTADCRNGPEPCNYCHAQQIPDSDTYINNQQMQNPGRYINDPGQQMYSNGMYYQLQTPKTAYCQPQQQCTQCTMNMVQPTTPTKPAQQYVNYVPLQPGIDYGRASIPDQPNAYSYAVDNSMYPPQSATPVPAQRPLTVCTPPQDVQNCCQAPCQPPYQPPCHVSCQAPCAGSGLPDLNNKCPGEQEDDEPRLCVNKRDRQWQSDDVIRSPTRRCTQNQGRYSDAEPDTQRRRSNDCDQDVDQKKLVCRKVDRVDEDTQRRRSNDCDQDVDRRQQVSRKVDRTRSSDYIEDTVRGRGLYNESPNRRGSRNNGSERNYEECLPGRKQYASERDVCSTDCNYEKYPSQRRRRSDDCDDYPETPTGRNPDIQGPRRTDQTICSRKPAAEFRKKPSRKDYVECTNQNCQSLKLPTKNYNCAQEPKAGTVPTDDVQYVACPAFRQTPKESPYHCQPDRIWKDREDRIAGKTRPPPRRCGYEDDRKASLPAMLPTRNRCRPPPEEIECECESEDETIPPKRRHRDNRQKRPSDDREDICCMGPKNRQEKGKGRREVFETSCTQATCPYLPRRPHSQEPCASPKKKPTKCYDDEREVMNNISRNQSPGRKIPRPRNDITDCERPKKDCTTVQMPKKKAPTDVCECSSDDNIYDQGKYDRYCDEGQERSPRETFKCCPRRTERNECYKSNARSQREYPDIDDDCDENTDDYCPKRGRNNMNNYLDECCCSSESDEYTKYKKRENPIGSRRREESPRNCPNYRDYRDFKRPTSKTTSPCRQSKRTDVYESEYDCPNYTPKRYDKKPCPRKQEYKSKEPDVYDSGYDCFCSSDDKKPRIERKPPPCSPRPRCKHCQREQKNENSSYVGCRLEKTVCRRKPIACQMKGPQNVHDNATKDANSEGNDFDCECEFECNEEKNGKPNGTLKPQVVCTCNCGTHGSPFEPLTQSFKRNPAGDGSPFDDSVGIEAALNHPSDNANTTWNPAYKLNLDLPFTEEPKSVLVPECSVPLPIKKKKPRPGSAGPSKNSKSLKPKSRTASPTRNSAPPKTQPGETAKKRTTSLSTSKRNALGGARRTTDQGPSAAANSKLPNDLNTASYFICKLQDDANSQQYLIVVPKEPIARCDTPRDDPGQGSWKQLHCQRQFSGFQSVSWGNPGSNSVFPSPPFHPIQGISERSSYAMPPGMTETTVRIVKAYLNQSMNASSPGLMQSFQPVFSPRSMLKRVLAGQKRFHPVDRPSSKANAAILAENRTDLVTKNPLQNLSSAEDKKEVIVLLPPVVGFRPSKNSLNTGAVEVQRLIVRNSGTDVKPRTTPTKTVPPRPPNKPKRKALR